MYRSGLERTTRKGECIDQEKNGHPVKVNVPIFIDIKYGKMTTFVRLLFRNKFLLL